MQATEIEGEKSLPKFNHVCFAKPRITANFSVLIAFERARELFHAAEPKILWSSCKLCRQPTQPYQNSHPSQRLLPKCFRQLSASSRLITYPYEDSDDKKATFINMLITQQ